MIAYLSLFSLSGVSVVYNGAISNFISLFQKIVGSGTETCGTNRSLCSGSDSAKVEDDEVRANPQSSSPTLSTRFDQLDKQREPEYICRIFFTIFIILTYSARRQNTNSFDNEKKEVPKCSLILINGYTR